VSTPPESTKNSLRYRLIMRTRDRWPELTDLKIRHRGQFAYVDGELPDGTTLPLFRLATADQATAGASQSTSPAAIATKMPHSPADTPSARPKKPSTAPAACTSTTPPPGPNADELMGVTTTSPQEVAQILARAVPCLCRESLSARCSYRIAYHAAKTSRA
jgi:hypothetical protein